MWQAGRGTLSNGFFPPRPKSRPAIYAYEDSKYLEMYASEWEKCVEASCRDFVNALRPLVSTSQDAG